MLYNVYVIGYDNLMNWVMYVHCKLHFFYGSVSVVTKDIVYSFEYIQKSYRMHYRLMYMHYH